jgi:signal transduction histidine kinase
MFAAFRSLRARLLLWSLAAIVPLFVLLSYTIRAEYEAETWQVQQNALQVAQLTATQQQAAIDASRHLLVTLAQLPPVQEHNSRACNALLADLLEQYEGYTNFAATTPDGAIFCSAAPLVGQVTFGDLAWLQETVTTDTFQVGDYIIGRVTGDPVLPVAYPIRTDDGEIIGVISASLDLSWLDRLVGEAALPAGARLTMVDRQGVILTRHPEPERWRGQPLDNPALLGIMRDHQDGTTRIMGADDDLARLVAFTTISPLTRSGHLIVSIPEATAFAVIRRNLTITMLGLTAVGAIFLAVLWIGIGRFIQAPVDALVETTRQLGEGKLEARSGLSYDQGELGYLARAVDMMAHTLKVRTDEAKASAEALSHYTEELERSNRELEQFAYVASHDLQEPLRKIQAFGDRLNKKYASTLGDDGLDYLVRMQSAANRMQTLIQDLLTFSRVTTRAQPFVPVDLAPLASDVLNDLETRLEETGGRVELGALPVIEAEPLQMRLLLQNLIGNALKFHREGQPPVVRLRAHEIEMESPAGPAGASKGVQLLIEDNGIGFDQKYADQIFGVFQRLHGRQEYEGTGIGLAVCRKIVERHGGTITARSAPGEGATFIVTLPIVQISPRKKESTYEPAA